MKKIILFSLITFIVINSCKKTTTETNTPPPNPPDSTHHDAPDTGHLIKTAKYYNYDVSGAQITDSSLSVFTYDGQGRMTLKTGTSFEKGETDTVNYTYTSNQRTIRYRTHYSIQQNFSDNTQTYYLNATGNADSVLANGSFQYVNNGIHYTDNFSTVYYFYYDAEGKDTFNIGYNIFPGSKIIYTKSRSFYTGNILDSMIQYNDPAHLDVISYIVIYAGENIASDEINPYGTPHTKRIYTYYDILSRGFYLDGVASKLKLTKSITQNLINPPGSDVVQEFAYTFDALNRVKTLTTSQNNIVTQKSEYTYR